MESLQGHFLVASPHLVDGNFNRSVVLMIKHNEEGAFGLVLNRPTSNSVAEIWKVVAEKEIDRDDMIYLGGPVSGPLVALHSTESAAEMEVMPGVYFSVQKHHLHEVVDTPNSTFRLFSGYSGWAGGQLETELEAGGWLVTTATPELVFYRQDDLWERIVKLIADDILSPVVRTKHVPEDPRMN
jgi:putative transcriptional regulator